MKKRFAIFALIAVILAPGAQGSATNDLISAKTIAGTRFSFAEARGSVVVVNFWATWCVPCRVEMPTLDAVYRRHRAEGLQMLAIAMDNGASIGKLRGATAPFAFPVARLADTQLPHSAIPSALPLTRIYGRDGRLQYDSSARKGQPLDEATFEKIVTPLLAEPAPPAAARTG